MPYFRRFWVKEPRHSENKTAKKRYTFIVERVRCNIGKYARVGKKRNGRVGKMDAILTDSHLDTRIKRCVLMNVIVPKLECAEEVW